MTKKMDLQEIINNRSKKELQHRALIGMSIGLIKDNETIITNIGYKNLKTKEVADEHTIYELGSIGKLFTAIMLQIGESRGDFKFDDSLHKHLNGIVQLNQKCKATLLHLATHTSGFPTIPNMMLNKISNFANPYLDLSISDLHEYLELCEENKNLGNYEYSNLGMGLLGYIFELKYDKDYETIIKEEILKKIGMINTSISLSKSHYQNIAQGYDDEGNESEIWIDKVLTGAGSFLTNLSDMLKFIRVNLNQEICEISEELQKCHIPKHKEFVGLGWHIEPSDSNLKIHWHNGMTGGCSTFIGLNKSRQIGLVILSNSTHEITGFGFDLINEIEKFGSSFVQHLPGA
jgi:CubicO group peptidase (beta-lactamase class C family)